MNKTPKDDIRKAQGLKGFLIPLEVLPESLNLFGLRSYHKLEVTGQIVEIEGERFFQTEKWKK